MSTSVNEALRVFNNHEAQARFSDDLRTPSPRTLNTVTPLDLPRPLEKASKTKYSAVSTLTLVVFSLGQFWLDKVGKVRKCSENSSS